jgi:hypothetical protein
VQVVGPFQLLAAANKALVGKFFTPMLLKISLNGNLLAETNNQLKTNTLHSELVYSLSASRNIADAYRKSVYSPKSDQTLTLAAIHKIWHRE